VGRGGISNSRQLYIFLWKRNVNRQIGTGFFLHNIIISAVKRVEFFSDRMPYINVKGRYIFYEKLEQVFDQFPVCHTKIFLQDFNAKVGKEGGRKCIFKPIIGNEILHEASNDNGVRVVNFATSKYLIVKSTTFSHRDIGLLLMVSHIIK
jgi:hypothetical protein